MLHTSLNALANDVYENSVAHGWYDGSPVNYAEKIALMHSELSEALEEIRNGHAINEVYYDGEKPEGAPVELADCLIRILDTMYQAGIDVDAVVYAKMAYNRNRPYKHGGKKF